MTSHLLRSPLLWLALFSLGFLAFARGYFATRNSGVAFGSVILTTGKGQVSLIIYPGLNSALDGWNRPLAWEDQQRAAVPTGYRLIPISAPTHVINQRQLVLSYTQLIAADAAMFILLIGFQLVRGAAREHAFRRLLASNASQTDGGPPA